MKRTRQCPTCSPSKFSPPRSAEVSVSRTSLLREILFTYAVQYPSEQRIFERTLKDSPGDDDDKVHDVPQVSHVTVLVQDEAVSQDLGQHLDGEDDHEYRL